MAKQEKRKQRAMWARAGKVKLARLDAKRGAARRAEELGAAEHAWHTHVVTLPFPHRWADLATRFVDSIRPKRSDATLALVLLCLSLARDWEELVDGTWICLAGAHRYAYFDARGYGDARTFDLLTKLAKWLRADGQIGDDELRWLLEEVDHGRQGVGLSRKHGPPTRDQHFFTSQIDPLVARFAETLDDPFLKDVAPSMLGLLATHLIDPTGAVRFGRLQAEPFVTRLLSASTSHEARNIVGFSRDLLGVASQFYGWLVEEGHLDPELGKRLASELSHSALRLTLPHCAESSGLV